MVKDDIQTVEIIDKVYKELVENCNARHRIIAGGRAKGASWSIARILLTEGLTEDLFIVCVREVQMSIEHSVKKLLEDTINYLNWHHLYKVSKTDIVSKVNRTKFIFCGLQDRNADNIKSLEGADRCWVAEAQSISRNSINILRPTIRKPNSVFWWDFNPRFTTDPIYVDYVVHKDPNAKVLWLNWKDNPWFNDALRQEMEADYARNQNDAEHIWEGKLVDERENIICPSKLVIEAMKRNIVIDKPKIPVVGADIAHQGGDEIVFYKRMGYKVVEQKIMRFKEVETTAKELMKFAGTNSVINIDNGHVGAAVADILENRGYFVNRINFGGSPKDKEHYKDSATEMYFELRDALPYADIPDDQELMLQISERRYTYVSGPKGYEVMKAESKDDFKEHTTSTHKSPDRGDALVLTFYGIENEVASEIAGRVTMYGSRR